ncbi:MAG: HAD-IIIA family hydrolase [Bacteroidota bacterium]
MNINPIMIQPDSTWTLFLDRDGVINIEKEADYIHSWAEFVFYDGVVDAIAELSLLFGKTIIVTNQKGIGKGVTKAGEVHTIHDNLLQAVLTAGGKIDAVLYCPDIDISSPNRKPNPGMAFQAKAMYPEIIFERSLMVGNNLSDMQFGRNAGMKTAFVRTTQPELALPEGIADLDLANLPALLKLLKTKGE